MDQLVAAAVTEKLLDLLAAPPKDSACLLAAVGYQPAGKIAPLAAANGHRVTPVEASIHGNDADCQQAPARRQCLLSAGVDGEMSARLECPGDPFLAGGERRAVA